MPGTWNRSDSKPKPNWIWLNILMKTINERVEEMA